MRLTLAEPRYLKDSISIISDLVNEARFNVTKDYIEMIAMDPANVAMVVFKLLSNCFTEYKIEKDQEIAINLSNLKQVLKRAKSNDLLTLSIEDNKLSIQLKGTSSRIFKLPILNYEEKKQKIPNLSFVASIKMTSAALNEAIEDVDIVGESVMFIADKDKFNVKSEGDLTHANVEIKKGEDTNINLEGSSQVKSKYSIEYLKKMMTASKISNEVEIRFSENYPLKLEYKEMDKVQLMFILAPRVED